MYKQAEEERQHAMDMAQFVLHRGGEVVLTAIDAVKTDWADAKEVFVDTLAHEQNVTELINRLADVADEERDRASQNFIAKYIDEQVEEERSVQDILDSFAHLSSSPSVSNTDVDTRRKSAGGRPVSGTLCF